MWVQTERRREVFHLSHPPADVGVMMKIPTPQSTRPNLDAPWSWPAAAEVLPNGLPAGALTVIRIRATSNAEVDWKRTVADLVHSTTANFRSVGYVPVDSDSTEALNRLTPAHSGEGGRIGLLLDEDEVVTARDDSGRPRPYGIGLPTLARVRELASAWEDDFGQSLIVLDGMENARPYPATSQDLVTFPGGITITRRAVDEWRALDVCGYANARPHAPTVVVWNDDGSPAHSDAIALLCDVACVIVEAVSGTDFGDFLAVSQRRNLDQEFPYPQAVRLP